VKEKRIFNFAKKSVGKNSYFKNQFNKEILFRKIQLLFDIENQNSDFSLVAQPEIRILNRFKILNSKYRIF